MAGLEVLAGFIERESGPIPFDEWLAFATAQPYLEQMKPIIGINPFTGTEHSYKRPQCFWVLEDGQRVGQLLWEEAECVAVYGSGAAVKRVVAKVCNILDATYGDCSDA